MHAEVTFKTYKICCFGQRALNNQMSILLSHIIKWSISHVIVLSIYGQDKVAAFKEMHRILKEMEEEYRNPRRQPEQ